MGKRSAALVGFTEWAPQRKWERPMFGLEACAALAAEALEDAGIDELSAGARNPYEPDTLTVEQKIQAAEAFAENVIGPGGW